MPEETKVQETATTPEEGKKRRGRPPGAGKKVKVKKEGPELYALGIGDTDEAEVKIVKADKLVESIKELAEQAEVKSSEVFVFEVGRKVIVETEVKITPA